jgi:L-fuconolactonase
MKIDSHHHLWKVDRGDYRWMSNAPQILKRDYLPTDLRPLLGACGIDRTIVVQAAQTEAETDWLLELARETEFIAGVTGWLDLSHPTFPERLTHYRQHPKFVAIRPMLQDLVDDTWILKPIVIEHLKFIAAFEFAFEFLVNPRHLPYVNRALEKVPDLRAVINHLAKPDMASGAFEPWATHMCRIAEFPNVHCKISGLFTQAAACRDPVASIGPYLAHVISVFAPDRILFGSDWPMCRPAAEYSQVLDGSQALLHHFVDAADLAKVFGTNAERFYRLAVAPPSTSINQHLRRSS